APSTSVICPRGSPVSSDAVRSALTVHELQVAPVSWDDYFCKLRAYHERHGDCNVPPDWGDEGLVRWVGRQRRAYAEGVLCGEHTKRLEDEGFDFEWSVKNNSFEQIVAMLRHYLSVPGNFDLDVPTSFVSARQS
ncbi:hypothetical protein CYMTET_8952, partial [Cymbomonas tetramitiformis]